MRTKTSDFGNLTCLCGSSNLVKAGSINGKRYYRCKDCGKRFTRESRYDKLRGTSQIGRIEGE